MGELKNFGNTDMQITSVGLGAWAIGGPWLFGWGEQDDKKSLKAIHAAIESGINWIDTAAIYGLGHSEKVVAQALKEMPDKPYVFTKCSLVWDDNGNVGDNLSEKSIRMEVENSLKRLEIDVIDLYQIHWPRPVENLEEGWETLNKLKEEGKVRWIGVSNFSVEQMERIKKYGDIFTLQPPYSAINRGVEDEILPYCKQNNIGVIAYSPMQSGLLTGKMTKERFDSLPADDWRRKNKFYMEPEFSKNLKLQELFISIANENNVKAAHVAIAWVLKNEAVTAAIVGMRSPEQATEITEHMDFRLSDEDYLRINEFIQNNL